MSTTTTTSGAERVEQPNRPLTTETKASPKTTEPMVYIAVVAGILVTAFVVGSHHIAGTNHSSADPFSARDAIRYIAYVTIGYMVARGLAKSGSRDSYNERWNRSSEVTDHPLRGPRQRQPGPQRTSGLSVPRQ